MPSLGQIGRSLTVLAAIVAIALDVSRIGLGAMGMTAYYLDPNSSEAESIRTIQQALDLGVTPSRGGRIGQFTGCIAQGE